MRGNDEESCTGGHGSKGSNPGDKRQQLLLGEGAGKVGVRRMRIHGVGAFPNDDEERVSAA